MMDDNKVIEVVKDVPAILDDNIIDIADRAEKRIEAIKKIKRVSLSVTNYHDWVDQGGKPWLQASGAEKIGRLFGISWRTEEPSYNDLGDGHFSYTFKGTFTLGNATIEAIGERNSKDGFFTTRYVRENGDKKKIELAGSEVDKSDVKKAAYTNCIGNGITRLLGIRNLTYDDLKEVGITKDQITHFEYKSSKPKEEQPTSNLKPFESFDDFKKASTGWKRGVCRKLRADLDESGRDVFDSKFEKDIASMDDGELIAIYPTLKELLRKE